MTLLLETHEVAQLLGLREEDVLECVRSGLIDSHPRIIEGDLGWDRDSVLDVAGVYEVLSEDVLISLDKKGIL